MAYAALVQDFNGGRASAQLLPEGGEGSAGGHDAMRRMALRYGRSKGVDRKGARSKEAGPGPTLYLVTVDADGVATDLDRYDGEGGGWKYTAGNRHVHDRRTWDLSGILRVDGADA